jgi:hypothetical protein
MKNATFCSLALGTLIGLYGCMDLGQSGIPKPKLPEPLAAEVEQAAPAPVVEAIPPAETKPAPARPNSEEVAAKYLAAYEQLGRVAKDLDDFAYDRKGRMNAAQIKEYLALCTQEAATIEMEVPALQPACEALGTMIFYASPLDGNITVDKRLAGYKMAVDVFKQNMMQLAPKPAS